MLFCTFKLFHSSEKGGNALILSNPENTLLANGHKQLFITPLARRVESRSISTQRREEMLSHLHMVGYHS